MNILILHSGTEVFDAPYLEVSDADYIVRLQEDGSAVILKDRHGNARVTTVRGSR